MADNQVYLDNYIKCSKDPWEFLERCVYTLDQVDAKNPKKKFPCHLPHLKLYTRIWQQEKKLLVPKSRRMTMSWTNIALFLWDSLFGEGRFNAIVSKKEEDADELIRRQKYIYENIPEDVIPRDLLPRAKYKYCSLEFPDITSKLQGFPQGADQLRQFTFSGIFADEMAFWEYAQKMYSSAFPTLEGGGRFTGVSSPAPGFFKQLVFDKMNAEGSIVPPKKHSPMQGVNIWRNTGNKFVNFELHYSADPKKRDKEYRDYIKSSMPVAQYLQEYELHWDSFAGKPVYQDYNEKLHATEDILVPEPGLPLLRGWDFGLTPACVIAQLQGQKLVVLHEFIGDRGIDIFSKQVLKQCAILWPEWSDQKKDWMNFIDPSGLFRKDTDENTCAKMMAKNGIKNIHPGALTWEDRRTAVEHFLLGLDHGEPMLAIAKNECPTLARGFAGGYRYSDKVDEIEPHKARPLKDEHSHVHDGFQYLASKVAGLSKQRKTGKRVPGPSYSFMKTKGGPPIPKTLAG